MVYKLSQYIDRRGISPLAQWLRRLRDPRGKAAIIRRLNRLELGQLGGHKPCREGVWELRVDVGPGYRIYHARAGQSILLLLCGGSKRHQHRDIELALTYWQDWQDQEKDS